jgi:phosphatidylinositol kinase/protein kinase (PI-3  family)
VLELLFVFLYFDPVTMLTIYFSLSENSKAPEFSAPAEATKMTVNQQHLKQAWDTSQISTREDWIEWMHRLGVEFMKESPSHALRACMSLVDIHPPLARELFNAAFLSCWSELYDQYQVCFILISLAHTYSKYDHGRKISSVRLSSPSSRIWLQLT